jgi:elongation factor G
VFKTFNEQHLGDISFFKVISGKLSEGLDVVNLTTNAKERTPHLFVVAGRNRQKVDTINAGDIGATVKLKDTRTFTTLADKSDEARLPHRNARAEVPRCY